MEFVNEMYSVYLAGLFDGRGCFHIRKDKKGYLQFKIKIADQSKEKIVKISGVLEKLDIPYIIDSSNTIWITSRGGARTLIERILPYSMLKKKEIESFKDKVSLYEEMLNQRAKKRKLIITKIMESEIY
ncbi:MAG: LAGLIDADG family homing endonuclease [Candidatus Paceibacterota bacterium]